MQFLQCLAYVAVGLVTISIFPPNIGSDYGWFGNIVLILGGLCLIGGLIGATICIVGNLVRVMCGGATAR